MKVNEMTVKEFWEYINHPCLDHGDKRHMPIAKKYCKECIKKIDECLERREVK